MLVMMMVIMMIDAKGERGKGGNNHMHLSVGSLLFRVMSRTHHYHYLLPLPINTLGSSIVLLQLKSVVLLPNGKSIKTLACEGSILLVLKAGDGLGPALPRKNPFYLERSIK